MVTEKVSEESIVIVLSSTEKDQELQALRNELNYWTNLNDRNQRKLRNFAEKLIHLQKRYDKLEQMTVEWTNALRSEIIKLEAECKKLRELTGK